MYSWFGFTSVLAHLEEVAAIPLWDVCDCTFETKQDKNNNFPQTQGTKDPNSWIIVILYLCKTINLTHFYWNRIFICSFYKNIFFHQVIVNWKIIVIILPSQSVDGNVNTLHCLNKRFCILWFLFSWKCPIMEYALQKEKQYKRIDSLRLKHFLLEFDHSYNLINLVLRKKIKTRSATTIIVWEQKSAMISKYSLIVVPISQPTFIQLCLECNHKHVTFVAATLNYIMTTSTDV